MDIVIVGAGAMGTVHAAILGLLQGIRIVAVVDVDEAAAKRLAEPIGAEIYQDLETLLAERRVDVVDIVTPHHLHASAIATALDHGADVICEKPLALSIDSARELERRAADEGRRLLVKHYQRHSTAVRAFREAVCLGRLGTPYLAVGSFASTQLANLADPDDWHGDPTACGGGVLIDAGYHLVDTMHHCFGRATEVTATTRSASSAPGKGEDVAALTIGFDSGVVASLVATWADTSLPMRFGYRAFCTDGMVDLQQADGGSRVRVYSRHEQLVDSTEEDWWRRANSRALLELVEDIRTGRSSGGEAGESIRTLATVLAAYDSARSGSTVRLPCIEVAD